MKKLLLVFALIAVANFSFAQGVTTDALRRSYAKANADSTSCRKMLDKIAKTENKENAFLGYKGAVTATMANHVKDKTEKLKLFREGRSLLEQSIIKAPNSVELKFLRLTIQSNCPKALGYNKDIASDKDYILKNYIEAEPAVKNMIRDFAKQSDVFTEAEKSQLK